MSSVWYCIPSARPARDVQVCIAAWRAQGYRVALWLDRDADVDCDFLLVGEYPGYAGAVNALTREVLERWPKTEWCVTGGDDTLPDPSKLADEIASELTAHFGGTFGICQPTGDRFAQGSIDRIAGSPWLGREWCLRANQGQGPFWPEFVHMFSDEALMRTAEKLGVYLRRRDLIHLHKHFQRESLDLNSNAVAKPVPAHLVRWNSPQHWNEMKAIFQRLEAEDFASCMPLAEVAA